MSERSYGINQIREQFPALRRTYNGRQALYFDGPGGSQVVRTAIEAMARYMEQGGANLHGQFPTSHETEEIIIDAKQAIADLLGGRWHEVVFGPNMTTLTFSIARSLGREWRAGDEIVVTQMDHRANVDPWLEVASEKGMVVRWLKVDPLTLTLDLGDLDSVITDKTRLVAVGLASNAIGTINDVKPIGEVAKSKGALLAVDAVHAVPHFFVDRNELLADVLLCSVYKFFGPHVGIGSIRSEVFAKMKPYKVDPAPGYIPDKLETGTQNHEGIAAIPAVVDFIAGLGTGSTRREQLRSGYAAIEEHENRLAQTIREHLVNLDRVTLYQAPHSVRKTPTIAFLVDGIPPAAFCRRMAEEYSIFVADGHFYASTLGDIVGVNAVGGWIRAGMAPYNTDEEVERFLDAIKQIIRT